MMPVACKEPERFVESFNECAKVSPQGRPGKPAWFGRGYEEKLFGSTSRSAQRFGAQSLPNCLSGKCMTAILKFSR